MGAPRGVYSGGHSHALSWKGTADSVTDLHQYAPIGYAESVATGIDANGNVIGYAYNQRSTDGGLPPDAIAVVFVPAPMPPAPISSLTLSTGFAFTGDTVTGQVTLATPAPAGGTTVSFASSIPGVLPAPGSLLVPEGQTSAGFTLTVPVSGTLTWQAAVTLYGMTGPIRASAPITVAPIATLKSITVNPVQGGNVTYGNINLNIATSVQLTVSLTNGNPALNMPATVTLNPGQITVQFSMASSTVAADTSGIVTATCNGVTVTTTATVSSSIPVTVTAVSIPPVYSGGTFTGTVTLNHAAYVDGATVLLGTGDATMAPVPASITIPYGSSTGTFTGTAGVVQTSATVPITATINGTSATGNLTVSATPGATFTGLDYWTISQLLKVTVTTTLPGGTLTFGINQNGPALGVLNLDATTNSYQGSISLPSAPTTVWVWNSLGAPVSSSTIRLRSR